MLGPAEGGSLPSLKRDVRHESESHHDDERRRYE